MNSKNRVYAEIAILVAFLIAFKMSFANFFMIPTSYSSYFTMEVLILSIIAYRWGLKNGLLASFSLLVIGLMLKPADIIPIDNRFLQILAFLLEYPIASLAVVFPGLLSKKVKEGSVFYFALGMFLFGLYKFTLHGTAGVIFWSQYLPSEYEGSTLWLFIWSFLMVNIVQLIDAILCIIVGLIIKDRADILEIDGLTE